MEEFDFFSCPAGDGSQPFLSSRPRLAIVFDGPRELFEAVALTAHNPLTDPEEIRAFGAGEQTTCPTCGQVVKGK